MAITIIQKVKRKKIILIVGISAVVIALLIVSYLTFMKSTGQTPLENEKTTTSILSQKLKRLEIKWDALKDSRFENLEAFPDVSSLEIEESGRDNPFLPY